MKTVSIIDILQDLSVELENGHQNFVEGQHDVIMGAQISPSTPFDYLVQLLDKYMRSRQGMSPLTTGLYDFYLYRKPCDTLGSDNNLWLRFGLSKQHPFRKYDKNFPSLDIFDIRVGDIVKKRVEPKEKRSRMLYHHIRFSKDENYGILTNAKYGFDLSIAELAASLDLVFYHKYKPFYERLCRLDELQSDLTPAENRPFTEALMRIGCGLSAFQLGDQTDVLDAEARYALITLWKNNCPKSLL